MNPGAGFGVDIEGRLLKFELGVWLIAVQGGRQDFVIERQGRLDEPCNPRCRNQVADHGFHRPHRTPGRLSITRAKDPAEGLNLGSITDRRSRPMRFDEFNRAWRDAGRLVGPSQSQFFPLYPRRQKA